MWLFAWFGQYQETSDLKGWKSHRVWFRPGKSPFDLFYPQFNSSLESELSDSLDRYDVLMTTPDSRPYSANGHCTPPLIMSHKFVLRGTKLDMISIIWLFILLIIELQIMATNRNILLYLICNWKTERPDSILDLRYKPRDTINIYWIWTAVLLASF